MFRDVGVGSARTPIHSIRVTACCGGLAVVYCFAFSAREIVDNPVVTLSWMGVLSVLLISLCLGRVSKALLKSI